MTVYGLLSTGFVPKTVTIVRDEINAELRETFGTSLDLSDSDPLGQLVGIVSSTAGELWEVAEAVYNSQSRDTATGAALDNLLLLTGTFRAPAAPSSVTLHVTGTPSTTIVDVQVSTSTTNVVFASTSATILATATAWATSTAYAVDDIVRNSSRIYICITAGTSAGSGGPTTTASDITDNTVHWSYVGEGTGHGTLLAEAVLTGPQVAAARDITTIVTPVGGWSSVINLVAATLGRDEATDEEARVTGEVDLTTAGESTLNAIRQELLALPGMVSATVFRNATDTTDADGVPPHSIEALVRIADTAENDTAVAEVLLNVVSGTSGTYGDESVVVADDAGNNHTISFSRPEEIEIYVNITIIKDAATYPADGDDQIKDAIVAYGDAQAVGKNAVSSSVSAQAFTVDGVLEVTTAYIGLSNPATASTTIQISNRQIAVFDTSRITVVTSNGTP